MEEKKTVINNQTDKLKAIIPELQKLKEFEKKKNEPSIVKEAVETGIEI